MPLWWVGTAIFALAVVAMRLARRIDIARLVGEEPWPAAPGRGWSATFGFALFAALAAMLGHGALIAQYRDPLWPLLLAGGLTVGVAVDLRHHILPDLLTRPLAWSGLLVAALSQATLPPADAVIGAVTGWWLMAIIQRLIFVLRGRALLGGGDVKLMGAAGAWCGWQLVGPILLLAALLAVLWLALGQALRQAIEPTVPRAEPPAPAHPPEMAFGPYLALAIWIAFLCRPWLLTVLERG